MDRLKVALHIRGLMLGLCERAPSQEEHERLVKNTVSVYAAINEITRPQQDEFDRAVVQG